MAGSRDEARRVQTVRMGTIESLRPVKIEGTKTPIGGGAGAIAGGVAGSAVGGGRGSIVAAVIAPWPVAWPVPLQKKA